MAQDPFEHAGFLIVDDEAANIGVLRRMLQQWDAINVVSTTDPFETLTLFHAFQPDLMLLDLMMPGLDGFGVMEQLQPLLGPDGFLPILVLTADTAGQTKRRALGLGAADFLTKPFDAIELSLRLHNLLERRFLRRLQNQNQVARAGARAAAGCGGGISVNDELFAELIASVREGGAILRGEAALSRPKRPT